jgi:hypothetical protein
MTVENYLMINKQTNLVDNLVMWDGNVNSWNPPSEYLMLPVATTMAYDWFWSDVLQDWELQENMGGANIGDTWNGSACITSATKESNTPYPTTTGIQDL